MSGTDTMPLPRKHFSFGGAADPVSVTAGLHAGPPHALPAITEPTKAETTR